MALIQGLLALLLLVVTLPGQSDPGAAEACFAQATNAARTAVGQAALPVSSQLSDEARAHSQDMATSNTLYHSTIRVQYGNTWKLIGENVGTDNSCDVVQQAFLNSPHHYQNIITPGWTSFGVGVVYGDNGTIWVTVAFVQANGSPAPAPVAPPPPAPAPPHAPAPAPPPPRAPAPVKTVPAQPPAVKTVPPPGPVPSAAAPAAPIAPAPSLANSPSAPPSELGPTSTSTGSPEQNAPTRLASATKKDPTPAVVGLIAALAFSLGAVGTWGVRLGGKRWRS